MPADKDKILEDVRKNNVKFIQLQFVDISGAPKSCEVPSERIETILNEGLWFDGSSIEGFARIYESDMYLKPDISTYIIYPWYDQKVARIICDVYIDEKTPFEGCPRGFLKKVLTRAKEMGFDYKVGPELEFFLFKDVSLNNGKILHSDSVGYFDAGPRDPAEPLKHEIVPALNTLGFGVEMTHHEVAPSQHEVDFRYDNALKIADMVITIKTTLKTLTKNHGLYASFMPKPIYGINGSGMHTHQSLWSNGKNGFYDDSNSYSLSKIAMQFLAGQLDHAKEISTILSPTVNSYKRLVPGYEAPVYICWGQVNRSALIRVPKAIKPKRPVATRLELRNPDPSCNPYLAFGIMLSAGLDGIKRKLQAPVPIEENVYHFDENQLKEKGIKVLPGSLYEALEITEKSEFVKESLGTFLFEKLIEIGKKQWEMYHTHVSDWEIQYYLMNL